MVTLKALGDQTHIGFDKHMLLVDSFGLVDVPDEAKDVLVGSHGFRVATPEDLAAREPPKQEQEEEEAESKKPTKKKK